MNRAQASSFVVQAHVAALLVVFSTAALSDGPLAKKLISSMMFKEQLESGRDECQKKASALDVAAIQTRNPSLFLGMDPSSSVWSKVEAAYIQYAKQLCLPVSVNLYSERAENIYLNRLSRAELQATIDFLETSAGKKFTLASAEVTKQVNETMSIEADSVQENAWKEYEGQILKLRDNELISKNAEKNR